jgi:hypothetical protein
MNGRGTESLYPSTSASVWFFADRIWHQSCRAPARIINRNLPGSALFYGADFMPDNIDEVLTDSSVLADQTREAVAKIRGMTDDLKAVLEHEERIAGDLMRCSDGTAAER